MMRKDKLLFILFFIMNTVLYSQPVQLESYLESGYYSGYNSANGYNFRMDKELNIPIIEPYHFSTGSYFENRIYTEMNFLAKWQGFMLSTTLLTVMKPKTFYSYLPLQTQYDISLMYRYKNILFNAAHMCTHGTEQSIIGGGFTRLGIRLYIKQ